MSIQFPLRIIFSGTLALAAWIPLSAWAGGTAVVQAGGEISRLAWQTQGPVRIGRQDANDYVLVRDGKAYSVSYRGRTPMVMEIGGLLQGLGAVAQSRPNQYLPDRVDSIQDTGKAETVAGIQGHVYRLTVTDTQGKIHRTDAVLTNEPLAVNMTETYLNTMQALFGSSVTEKLTGSLPANRRGILRLGKDFVLKSISSQEPPANQFALPAQPTNLQNLLQGLQGLKPQ